LATIFADADFVALFPVRGQPAEAPWRLALVTVLQFVENLSDRRAADAVRARIDWKYALGLEQTDPGFDSSVLSEFRTRLVPTGRQKLAAGRILFLRRVSGSGTVTVLSQSFRVGKRHRGLYLRLVIDTGRGWLTACLNGRVLKRWPYKLLNN
jgi:hypothetical protein